MTDHYGNNSRLSLAQKTIKHFKGTLLGGLLLLIPAIATYLVLHWLFNTIDGLLQPIIQETFHMHIPGLGILMLVIVLYIAGLAEENYLGRGIFSIAKTLILRIPIIGFVYSSAKQLVDALSGSEGTGFKQVVMIEYPRKGAWTIGFLTSNTSDGVGNEMGIVYIPTAPTPNSGWITIIPNHDILYTDLTVQAAMTLVLSGGIIAPEILRTSKPC